MHGDELTAAGPRSPIQWLLLDVGGVLEAVDDAVWPSRFRARWARRLGLSDSQMSARLATADLPDTRTTAGVADEYWAAYGSAVGASSAVLEEMRADFWNEYCGTANADLLAFLRALQGAVGLAILSNSGDGAREEEERRFGFSALFDPIVYSHESGASKPDPLAFELALSQMGTTPSEVLFIDDSSANVDAARRIGLRAHLHANTADTLAAIRGALRGEPRAHPA